MMIEPEAHQPLAESLLCRSSNSAPAGGCLPARLRVEALRRVNTKLRLRFGEGRLIGMAYVLKRNSFYKYSLYSSASSGEVQE